ncbi:achaete-scute homolog 2-like [Topomyia yanbarensis]|uniref:achaete-scute homolog 2-like n=1 Tax=Topomyia yanbarensis TaxID=2498891 RepID=UPI00273CADD9|nr:achaete-scute homolog 2-like [Topomyia yanbarensis]
MVYDPLGLIGNFLMYLKTLLQEIWRSAQSPSQLKSSSPTTTVTFQPYRAHKHTTLIERRNQRERVRVRAVNEAFARLRQMVPATRSSAKRVSKVKTLKRAVEYIAELSRRLATFESILIDSAGGGIKSRSPTRRWKTLPVNYEPFQLE